jgi:hypothetical protein
MHATFTYYTRMVGERRAYSSSAGDVRREMALRSPHG